MLIKVTTRTINLSGSRVSAVIGSWLHLYLIRVHELFSEFWFIHSARTMPQSLTMKRLHQRLIQLLLVSLIIMWFFNIQSVCFIDYSLENTEHLKHPLIQTNPSNNTSPTIHEHHIYNPILIPSNNKKYHLKHQLAQELEPVVTIYPNHTFAIHQELP